MPSKKSKSGKTRFSTKVEGEFEIQQSVARVLLGVIAIAIFMIFILGNNAVPF